MIQFALAGTDGHPDRVRDGGNASVPTDLSSLASAAHGARVTRDATVTNIAYDSRAVVPGTLFFCVPGEHADGHTFAPAAVAAGASALVVERALDIAIPQMVVPSVRSAMGPLADAFFGHPSRAFRSIGITGTNGKTTTAFMLESLFVSLGMRPGLIGTVERHIGNAIEPASRTTPEAIDLQRLFARMRDAGVEACAMEVSSEGLAFERVEGTWFECGVFTNLSQDHLNTHGTMEAYFEAKAALFRPEMCARAVLNIDDEHGRLLRDRIRQPVTTFSMERDADVCARSVVIDASGSDVVIVVDGVEIALRVPLPARYNVANALAALGVARAMGWDLEHAARGIASTAGVPGRLERVDGGREFTVLVDYAHTPDSLEGVLRAARELVGDGARLIAVFGCGGDRDRTKRPMMGRAGVALSDLAIITSDNPRTEDPAAIIADIERGARETARPFRSLVDRREAIATAISEARAGDVIVIAGKGHETGQQFADHTIPFDDRIVAREILDESR